MEREKLAVRLREGRGTKSARELRVTGDIPGVIYSASSETAAISVNARDLRRAVAGPSGIHTLLDVTVGDAKQARVALIKDLQLDPVRDRVIHIDLHEIRMDQPIQTVVSVHLEGQPHGVTMGGVLSQPTHEVNISVLPTEIPEGLTVDVSAIEIGGSLRLAEVPVPDGVTVLDDLESTVIASVSAPISEEELEGEPAEGEEAEAATGEAEGEQPVGDSGDE